MLAGLLLQRALAARPRTTADDEPPSAANSRGG